MMRPPIALILLLLGSCTSFGAKIDLGYSEIDSDGALALDTTRTGTPLPLLDNDLNDDFGLPEKFETPYGRLQLDTGPISYTVSAFSLDDQGTGRLKADFGTISAATDISTDLDIKVYKAAMLFDLFDFGAVRVAPGFAADVLDTTILVSPLIAPALNEDVDQIVPIPMLFAQAEIDFGIFEVVADAGWLSLDVDQGAIAVDGSLLDLEALVRFKPLSNVHLFAGYRYVNFEIEATTNTDNGRLDLVFSGWMVGAGFSF
ncbi:MAG: hypothetical protein ACE5F1_16110 [Planctomycetota bacterium]